MLHKDCFIDLPEIELPFTHKDILTDLDYEILETKISPKHNARSKNILWFGQQSQINTNIRAREVSLLGMITNLKILDEISSKNELIKLINNEEFIYKDLAIKSIKCTDSKFDDNPEVKAYIQVRDLTKKNRNNVFVFNGWMFSSSPSIAPFDHPVYDIWLVNCY